MPTTKVNAVKLLNNVDHAISLYNEFATKRKLPTLSYTDIVETKYLVNETTKEDYKHTRNGNVCTKKLESCSQKKEACCTEEQCGQKKEACCTEEQCEGMKVIAFKISSDNCEMKKTLLEAQWALEKSLTLLKKAKRSVTCARILAGISLLIAAGTIILSYYS